MKEPKIFGFFVWLAFGHTQLCSGLCSLLLVMCSGILPEWVLGETSVVTGFKHTSEELLDQLI